MKNSKILLVDDNSALRGMLSFSLETAGYEVIEAESRAEAILQLKQQAVPVVILDMGMPPNQYTPEEGLAVLDWIVVNQPETKVVVLTGQDDEGVSYLALKKGAFDFLEKPITVVMLLVAVKRACLFYEQTKKLKQEEGIQKVQIEVSLGQGVKETRNQAEQKLVKQVLADTGFNVHEAARRLGLKRENMYYLIKKYNLQREEASEH
ncbi:Response regulator [hydrothermal vent metagenome]|uniref:Response regulator n=1 Tax=hydrothermal vent metagenome TaxID=652676 RepID=A0A3B0W9K2_9ZZZZ